MSPPIQSDPTSRSDDFLRETLESLKQAGLTRSLRRLSGAPGPRIVVNGRSVLLLCSNNYLGLATDERVKQAAAEAVRSFGCGATGSRLISGNLELYTILEQELAEFKSAEAALVFPSGYQANLGVVSALAGPGDAIFSDALNHASLIDGSRLSRARMAVYKHGDPEDLERKMRLYPTARRKLILTESVFSMDGDLAPLKDLVLLAKKHRALLLVDEAHATGIFGPHGAGCVEALGLQAQVDIQMGTFSKALGSLGGYIAGSSDLIRYLLNRARSFVFTTGLPPAVLAASTTALRIARQEPQHREALWRNVRQLRASLLEIGFDLGPEQSQILPLRLGPTPDVRSDARRTMAACRFLLRQGVFVQGIRPPTVPAGTARLRIAPTSVHSEEDIAAALTAFQKLQSALQSPKRSSASPLSFRA